MSMDLPKMDSFYFCSVITALFVLTQNDPGITTMGLGNHFTTFMKARIFCEREVPPGRQFAGSVDYNYNEISELLLFIDSR